MRLQDNDGQPEVVISNFSMGSKPRKKERMISLNEPLSSGQQTNSSEPDEIIIVHGPGTHVSIKDTGQPPPSWFHQEDYNFPFYVPELRVRRPGAGPSGPKATSKPYESLGYKSLRGPGIPRRYKVRRWFGAKALTEQEAREQGKVWSEVLDYWTQQPIKPQ